MCHKSVVSSQLSPEGASLDQLPTGPRGMVEAGQGGTRLPLGEDLVVGHVHARSTADTEASSLSPRIKRRIRTKTSLAEIERKERGRSQIPAPPRLRTLLADAAETPISEGSLVPVSTPTSGPPRAHPYTPVGNAMGSSSFEMVPSARARAASDRGYDESTETIPIVRASSSPSIIQVPTQIHPKGPCSPDYSEIRNYTKILDYTGNVTGRDYTDASPLPAGNPWGIIFRDFG